MRPHQRRPGRQFWLEENGDDAESFNDGSPGVHSLDMVSGDDGSDDESACLSVIEVMVIDFSLDDSDYEPLALD
jgi:hypothetical protein